jgi:hypothetical protein
MFPFRSLSPARIALLCCTITTVACLLYGIQRPINDPHSFRQSQTAISAYWMVGQPDTFAGYTTPIFGLPEAIPFEAPFYQYLMARAHELSGVPLDAAGRAVSIGAFLLLVILAGWLARETGLSADGQDYIRILLLSSPVYLFWSRAVLIESTALLLAVAGVCAVLAAVNRRSLGWLLVGALVGSMAALAKVTTWAVAAGCGCLLVLAQGVAQGGSPEPGRPRPRWGWLAAGLLAAMLPVIPAKLWIAWTDQVKVLNEFGRTLTSAELSAWNFGSLSQRLGKELYVGQLGWVRRYLISWSTLPLALLLLALGYRACARDWRRWLLPVAFLGAFASGPLIFANLYYVHDYYWYASGIWLLFALAAVLVLIPLRPQLAGIDSGKVALGLVLLFAAGGYASWWRTLRPLISDHRVEGTTNRPGWEEIARWRALAQREVLPAERLLVFSGGYSAFWMYYAERKGLSFPTYHPTPVKLEQAGWKRILADEQTAGKLGAMFVEQNEWRTRPATEWIEVAKAAGFAPGYIESTFGYLFPRPRAERGPAPETGPGR